MSEVPNRRGAWVFALKVAGHRLRRALLNRRVPVPRHKRQVPFAVEVAAIRVPLYGGSEPSMELGKVQNLRQIAALLDGIVIPPGETFSFWRQTGRCRRGRGFVEGREIRQGCIVPSVGGGICGLTNSLYEAALKAGLEIVERHAHSKVIPGSAAERGMDATVAWNYLDLRLRAPFAWQICVRLNRDELIVTIRAEKAPGERLVRAGLRLLDQVGDCATCGVERCFRHAHRPRPVAARTAYWVDESWPEFSEFVADRDKGSLLFAPMDGRRWRRPNYAWSGADQYATATALYHAWLARRLTDQGALRQQALARRAEELALRYAAMTPFDVDEIVLPIGLLPYAWQSGVLGGRRFRVLATRLPLAEIHRRLDEAYARFPERALLGDYRAVESTLRAEREALGEADAILTPHAENARLFGHRAVVLPWKVAPATWTPGKAIGFPGPVVGRKGAYELREAARRLGLTVVTPGRDVEGDDFWGDVEVRRGSPLDGTFAVVQPALLEDNPRTLLRAQASGCPVVVTAACGIEGAIEIPPLDVNSLVRALQSLSGGNGREV